MTSYSESVTREDRDGVAILWIDNPPVNALSYHVRVGLDAGVRAIFDDPAIVAMVLACRGRTFIAGADIREFGQPPKGVQTNEVRELFESGAKPVVAAIHGTALGGGLEMALVCHLRVAESSARLGLPEVKLGLLPGGGGTQRLPRLVGVEKALDMITSGRHLDASEALEIGLVDRLVDGDLTDAAVEVARAAAASGEPPPRVRDRTAEIGDNGPAEQLFADFRRQIARKTRGFQAPENCIRAIEAAVALPFEEGLVRERELFQELVAGLQSKAQRYAFFAERAANKVKGVDGETPRRKVKRVGVLGAGTMGGGIAMSFANAGIPVTIVEAEQSRLDHGLGVMRANYDRSIKGGRFTAQEVEERMNSLSGSLDKAAFADVDLVVEAVFENMDLKKSIFAELDGICGPDTILASNTSYLDINEIASVTGSPERVLGTHFFSPANVMKLVEIVRGEQTAPDVLATAIDLARQIGKVPVVVGVCHGFVGNRMLAQRRIQADRLVLEGAMPWDVDRVLYDFGLPMGPFAMSDLAGLDIGWQKETTSSSTLREVMCEAGRLGQKSGAGYYIYDAKTRAGAPDPEVEQMIRDFAEKQGIASRQISDDEILARCTYPMVNEGAKILEEGIAERASDIDVIWVNGYGWPVYRGGPMFWADHLGLEKIVETYDDYRDRVFGDWQVAPLLRRLASEGGKFTGE